MIIKKPNPKPELLNLIKDIGEETGLSLKVEGYYNEFDYSPFWHLIIEGEKCKYPLDDFMVRYQFNEVRSIIMSFIISHLRTKFMITKEYIEKVIDRKIESFKIIGFDPLANSLNVEIIPQTSIDQIEIKFNITPTGV